MIAARGVATPRPASTLEESVIPSPLGRELGRGDTPRGSPNEVVHDAGSPSPTSPRAPPPLLNPLPAGERKRSSPAAATGYFARNGASDSNLRWYSSVTWRASLPLVITRGVISTSSSVRSRWRLVLPNRR